ncbi:PrsW family intramembrane metalloprotease [Actinomadura parmotrematis]|uniref:PrsW family intramembrane metalloprotease n=1 Tax=Actinomadura parmotrematis TaxID=2864039 RepID=A0ABS7FSP7_9ACTN|nr:PrsW family intramembrane metalloprotease [Actinomadura parmotrematis]MBW8482592.1 PrsW family intramembrane metalloprotease [Actinomadura parmotrematis]
MTGTRAAGPEPVWTPARLAGIFMAVACAFGLGTLVLKFFGVLRVFPGAAVLAVLIGLVVLAIGYALIRRLTPVRSPPRDPSLVAVAWGATAASGCALVANSGLMGIWSKTTSLEFAEDWRAALTAPLNEELLKGAGVALLAVLAPRALRGPMDGMAYGALTGLGFQMMENVTYALNQQITTGGAGEVAAVVQVLVVRVGLTGPGSHWAMSAVAGAGIGYLAARGVRGLPQAVPLVIAAMAMHWLFDAPLMDSAAGVAAKTAINFAAVVALYAAQRWGFMARARQLLHQDVAAGRLPADEAAAVPSRRQRRGILLKTPEGPEREAMVERQRDALERVHEQAADACTMPRA